MFSFKMKSGLSLICAFCLGLSASANAAQIATSGATDEQIVHLLNRMSYGPAPGDIDAVRSMGIDAYIEQQLHPNLLPRNAALDQTLSQLPDLSEPITQMTAQYHRPDNFNALPDDQRKAITQHENTLIQNLSQAKILRAVASPAQLQEVMTDFWFNHFNVYAEKGLDKVFINSYERDAIRPHALGKFKDLLMATASHPAMIYYLDNAQNTDPNSLAGRNAAAHGKDVGINENYAREVMELHTLGINGGYTQQDVTNLAHILTGWGLGEGKGYADKASFFFEPRRHDYANVTLLGTTIRGGGIEEIEDALNMLAHRPATAKHISYELAQYFVSDTPPQGLVDRMSATFMSSDGDITAVLRTLFKSPEFWDTKNTGQKFKPPFRYVVSTMRASGFVPPGDTRGMQGAIAQMGEPLYRCLTPNGYSNTNDQWLNSDALLKRIDFSKTVAGYLPDGKSQSIINSLGKTWSDNTLKTAQAPPNPKQQAALLLSSPEFVYY